MKCPYRPGHLCLASLHATSASQALERILSFFRQSRHAEVLMGLSLNLRGIVSQRLVIGKDGKRLPAVELLIDTPRIRELIKKGDIGGLKEAMVQGSLEGNQTFDMNLYDLYATEKR
ncbi:MAG: hypothetical protein FJY88_10345 [Candidatus Eisenbacteria bacterium]|nr:hypothetical protein [Candidatus Eisenbacteria bacterium]